MLIIFRTKEKAEEKMKDIKEWVEISDGFYLLDYIKLEECFGSYKGIEVDKIYFESEVK